MMDEDCLEFDCETTCSVCNAEFLDREDLKVHMVQYHINETNQRRFCTFCSILFSDIAEFVQHIRKEHLCTLKPCQYCTRLFNDDIVLMKHERKHKSSHLHPKMSCSQCPDVFSCKSDLENHEYDVHGQVEDSVMLQYCFPELSAAINMNVQTLFLCLQDDNSYTCTCKFSTKSIYEYSDHLAVSKCRSFVCDKCCSVFNWKSQLVRHMLSHMQIQKPVNTQKCLKCNKTFHLVSIKTHMKKCKEMQCTSCGITFNSVDEYAIHVTSHPKSQVQFVVCKFCWRPIVGMDALEKHIERTHKPHMHLYKYYCLPCNRVFKHPKLLFGHFFSKHKDLEPYTCRICDKKFKIRKCFTLHIKLDHKSIGFVEFDENFHVFFTDKKSEKPFEPRNRDYAHLPKEKDINNTTQFVNVTMKKNSVAALGKDLIDESVHDKSLNTNEDNIDNANTETLTVKNNSTNNDGKQPQSTRPKRKLSKTINLVSSDDSDAPLCSLTKRKRKRGKYKQVKPRFICDKCNRNCYTYLNYQHHMSMHRRNEEKACVKCSAKFKTKEALNIHMRRKHSYSKLTDTLKKLLDKRKSASKAAENQSTNLFQKTIKKVPRETINSHATIIVVEQDKSPVKKFIENFKPENSENTTITNVSSVHIKKVTCDIKEPLIKMSKHVPEPDTLNPPGLQMPIRFKDDETQKHRVSIKLVRCEYLPPGIKFDTAIPIANCDSRTDLCVDNNDNNYEQNNITDNDITDSIPDVGEEVQLTCVDNKIKLPHTSIVLNNLPFKNIRIGHLSPQAPFYKIVKINEVLKDKSTEMETYIKPNPSNITLPNGTKLVTVNPLAHLLDKASLKNLENAAKSKKIQKHDFGKAIAKAMKNLDISNVKSKNEKKPV